MSANLARFCAIAILTAGSLGAAIQAAGQPAGYSPPDSMRQIVKLTDAHVGDDVLLAFIAHSESRYNLIADDVLYLNAHGVSQRVISSLLQGGPASGPPAGIGSAPSGTANGPPAGAVNFAYFKEQLDPYGQWQDLSANGTCWVPNELQSNPNWRPYVDHGSWAYTQDGWYWKSDYPWGEIVFHYGRWVNDVTVRWGWVPGFDWGPAWVAWRSADAEPGIEQAAVGWAPLPPAAKFESGVGMYYNGTVAGPDTDYGIVTSSFVFVDAPRFWQPNLSAAVIVDPDRLDLLYGRSVAHSAYAVVGGRFVMNGLGTARVAVLSRRPVRMERVMIRDPRIRSFKAVQQATFYERRRVLVNAHALPVAPPSRVARPPVPVNAVSQRPAYNGYYANGQARPAAPGIRPQPNAQGQPQQPQRQTQAKSPSNNRNDQQSQQTQSQQQQKQH